jgi:hypothetical protein
MATNYPGALDSLTNPTASDTLDSATVPHASQHANANDAIEAIESTLGVNPQGSSASVAARFATTAVLAAANAFTVGGHVITNAVTTVIPMIIKRVLNQTADLIQYQMSTGAVLGGRNANAQIWTGGGIPNVNQVGGATTAATGDGTTATITMTSATNLAVGDIVIVQNIIPTGYNGTYILTGVSNTSPYTISYTNSNTASQTVAGRALAPAQMSTQSRSAGTVALIAKGTSSQTANIIEIQNSAGSVLISANANGNLSSSSSSGAITAATVGTHDGTASLIKANGAGMLQMSKASSGSAPGTVDFARLAIVTGTNANTVKLVIAAGNGGAVTTILDNIPNPT